MKEEEDELEEEDKEEKEEGEAIQNTVVQSIELQGKRCGTGRDARIAATLE